MNRNNLNLKRKPEVIVIDDDDDDEEEEVDGKPDVIIKTFFKQGIFEHAETHRMLSPIY